MGSDPAEYYYGDRSYVPAAPADAASVRVAVCGWVLVLLALGLMAAAVVGGALLSEELDGAEGLVVGDGLWRGDHQVPPHLGGWAFHSRASLAHALSIAADARVAMASMAGVRFWPRPEQAHPGANIVRVVGCPYSVLAMHRERAVLYVVDGGWPIELVDVRPALSGRGGASADTARADQALRRLREGRGLMVAFQTGTLGEYRQAKRRLGERRDDFLYLARPPGSKSELAVLDQTAWTAGGKDRLVVVTADESLAQEARKAGYTVRAP